MDHVLKVEETRRVRNLRFERMRIYELAVLWDHLMNLDLINLVEDY